MEPDQHLFSLVSLGAAAELVVIKLLLSRSGKRDCRLPKDPIRAIEESEEGDYRRRGGEHYEPSPQQIREEGAKSSVHQTASH